MIIFRRQHSALRAATVVAAVAALLASACGSGDGGGTDAGANSPLAEFLGQPDFSGDDEAAQAQVLEEERKRQELIAQCMQDQGFEYVAQDPSEFISFGDDTDDYGTDEWIAKWGFGITTQYFSQDQVGPDLIGYDESVMGREGDFVDPNQDYVESLGPSEQEAYWAALYGGPDAFPAFDESMSEEEIEAQMEDFQFEPQGCEGEAYSSEDTSFGFYQEFQDELQEMSDRMEADPRVVERNSEIRSCVTDKGLEYESMDKVYQHYYEEMEKLSSSIDQGDYPDLSEEEVAQMSEAELQELFAPPELSDEAKATLGELQAEEIELAMAVNECGGGFEAEYELLADIRAEYEQEFLETYAEELEQYRAG
jgi:hypothetical protein